MDELWGARQDIVFHTFIPNTFDFQKSTTQFSIILFNYAGNSFHLITHVKFVQMKNW